MKNVLANKKQIMAAVALLGIIVIAAAWQTDNKKRSDTTANYNTTRDTTEPGKRNNDKDELRIDDLDKVMKELNIQMQSLDLQMKDLNVQLKNELSKIDVEKINNEVSAQLKKIDLDKIKIDVDKSMEAAKEQMKNIDMDKLKIEMQELQRKFNSDDLKKEIDDAMKGAKEGIEKAKKELQDLKDFTDQLQKDGLIDKKKGYSIEWKNGGELYINGKKQPKEISDKYRKYYKKDGWRIEMNGTDSKSRQFI